MISVIIPAYNSARYLENAVESVLRQSYQDFEIIIVCDDSPDNTFEVARALASRDRRVTVIENEKKLGVANSRNRGFAVAKGEYIALLDSDDIWEPLKLEKQLEELTANSLDLCYTAYSLIDNAGRSTGRKYQIPPTVTIRTMLRENVIGCSTVMFRASLVKRFQMRANYECEDFVFWLELLQAGLRFGGIDECHTLYRVSKDGRASNKMHVAKNRFFVYRNFLGLGFIRSVAYFLRYAVNGFRKYYR